MSTTPQQVEPGQVWRDNDERSKGAGEFVVRAIPQVDGYHIIDRSLAPTDERGDRAYDWCEKARARGLAGKVAIVERQFGHFSRIRVDRLLKGGNTQRGYTYIGRAR